MKKNINNLFVRINDKGFMISTLIYGIFIMFIVILSALMVTLNYRKNAFSNITVPESGGGMTPGTKTDEEGDEDVIITESELNGLIPVKYVDSAGNIVKDSGTGNWVITTIDDPEWFDYGDGRWANAVKLKGTYTGSQEKGTILTLSDSVQYIYVWIPRYQYTIGCLEDENNCSGYNNKIDIEFISTDIYNIKKIIPRYIYSSSDENVVPSNWYVHPAFENASRSTGFWVFKNHLGSSGSDNTSGAKSVTKVSDCSSSESITNIQWAAIEYLELSKYSTNANVYSVNSMHNCNYWHVVLGYVGNGTEQDWSDWDGISPSRTNVYAKGTSFYAGSDDLAGHGFFEIVPFHNDYFTPNGICDWLDVDSDGELEPISCSGFPWFVRRKVYQLSLSRGNQFNLEFSSMHCLYVR